MTVDTKIVGGTVVTGDNVFEAGVAIDDGKIVDVGVEGSLPEAADIVDASGKLVMPGFIDPHVHFDEVPEYRIGHYDTEMGAAAVGGITTCIDFSWQGGTREETASPDHEGSLRDGIEFKLEKGKDAIVDFGLHSVITQDQEDIYDQMDEAVDMGVTSFKMFMTGGGEQYSIGSSKGFIERVLEHAAQQDSVVMMHTEEGEITEERIKRLKEEGTGDPEEFPQARPDYAEAMAAEHAARLAKITGAKYYGVHTTCRKVCEELARYREDGSIIRAETCTHYTTLDASLHEELGHLVKVGPPLRAEDDTEAMMEYLRNGVLNIVSTDNCSYTLESKEVENWWDAVYGFNTIQWSVPVFHDVAINQHGLSYPFLVRKMSTNVANTFGLPNKGTLDPGTDADVVIFDPDETYTITAEDSVAAPEYCVYEGREVTGNVTKTFVRGELVAEDGDVLAEPGYGEFIERELPDWSP